MPLQAEANAEAYKPLVAWVCEVQEINRGLSCNFYFLQKIFLPPADLQGKKNPLIYNLIPLLFKNIWVLNIFFELVIISLPVVKSILV